MSRDITNAISIALDGYNIVICLFIMLVLLVRKNRSKTSKYFFAVCASVLIFNIADTATWFAEGLTHRWYIPYLHSMCFIFYFIVPVTLFSLIRYLGAFIESKTVLAKKICITVNIVSLLYFIGVVLSTFTDCFYYITPDNVYHRGKYIYICYVFFAIFYGISVWAVLSNRKYLSKKNLFAFLSYALFPLIAESFQVFIYGLSFVNTAMTLSILLVFINAHLELENVYEEKNKKLLKTEKDFKEAEKNHIKFQDHVISQLSNLLEERDLLTGEHAQRCSYFIAKLALQAQKDKLFQDILTDDYILKMVKAAPLHDVGKIKIPDRILLKKGPERLTNDEYEIMKTHSAEGGRIVADIVQIYPDEEFKQIAYDMAKYHHERWNGMGYPNKLKGEEIPLCARIMAIADVFDALVYERCYRKPIPVNEALKMIKDDAGTAFDPVLVEEFLKVKDEVAAIVPETYIEEL